MARGFVGDLDKNEVELDLSKFVELLQSNYDLKEQLRQLEVDGTNNPWVKWIHLARAVDAWRIFPRIFITVYMWLVMYTAIWFMNLSTPTMEQAGLISVVIGAGAAWFGLYCNTGGGRSSARALEKLKEKDGD